LIRRDGPYYDPTISRGLVAGMAQFARDVGILKGQLPYEQAVATQFTSEWAT
jgi:NitT/TauT family transport system substrate-binding protein